MLANGINTNLLACWRRDYLSAQVAGQTPALIPVHVVQSQPASSPARPRPAVADSDGEIEVKRNNTTVINHGTLNEEVLDMVLRELLLSGLAASR